VGFTPQEEDANAGGGTEIAPNYKIENVVATVVLDIPEKIDLNILARKYDDVEYNPERFPGLVMRVEKPKATVLVFSTGKMVVTGLRQASFADEVVGEVVKRIKKAKISVANPVITVQNIVASGDLHTPIDLNMAAVVMESAMYEPEVFPGLIYRMADPKVVFLLFSTGKIVCTGGKTEEMVSAAVQKLSKEVQEYGVAKGEGEEFSDDLFL
jgi:transcription initiation factor TFIID TATA-box-binding protein